MACGIMTRYDGLKLVKFKVHVSALGATSLNKSLRADIAEISF